MSKTLSGVIAAVATPIDESGAPDLKRATDLARHLLDNGCDGLNVLGSTGEATSFSVEERNRRCNSIICSVVSNWTFVAPSSLTGGAPPSRVAK